MNMLEMFPRYFLYLRLAKNRGLIPAGAGEVGSHRKETQRRTSLCPSGDAHVPL